MISDSLEQKINSSLENKYLLNLFSLEKSLVYYLNAINANSIVIEKLKNNADKIRVQQRKRGNCLMTFLLKTRSATVRRNLFEHPCEHDGRGVSIVSNNLNVLMKTLNIITIAIMVPTFVVSAFSMNVRIPLATYHFAFWVVMGLALLSVAGFFFSGNLKMVK